MVTNHVMQNSMKPNNNATVKRLCESIYFYPLNNGAAVKYWVDAYNVFPATYNDKYLLSINTENKYSHIAALRGMMSMKALVLQSDFGLSDGAVSAMYGVANSVQPDLRIFDLTHDIPPFNIWEGSYRLLQTVAYWPAGSVFVSVVDPGVGSDRKSIVAKTTKGHYIITPDNGTITHMLEKIQEVRILDERKNRLPNSGESYTFHGRDIYAYTGARLASEQISFHDIGPLTDKQALVTLPVTKASSDNRKLNGIIEIHDNRFGNIWTNIHSSLVKQSGIGYGDILKIAIYEGEEEIFREQVLFGHSFADEAIGEPIAYLNSLHYFSIAINQQSMAKKYNLGTGHGWRVVIESRQ